MAARLALAVILLNIYSTDDKFFDLDSGGDLHNEQISKFYDRQACSCSHFTGLEKPT